MFFFKVVEDLREFSEPRKQIAEVVEVLIKKLFVRNILLTDFGVGGGDVFSCAFNELNYTRHNTLNGLLCEGERDRG